MSIVARIKFSSKMKNSNYEIGYYSYTKRYGQLGTLKGHSLHFLACNL